MAARQNHLLEWPDGPVRNQRNEVIIAVNDTSAVDELGIKIVELEYRVKFI